jgi:hypothetical protein
MWQKKKHKKLLSVISRAINAVSRQDEGYLVKACAAVKLINARHLKFDLTAQSNYKLLDCARHSKVSILNCVWTYNVKWALVVHLVDSNALDLGEIGELKSVIAVIVKF